MLLSMWIFARDKYFQVLYQQCTRLIARARSIEASWHYSRQIGHRLLSLKITKGRTEAI